MEKAKNLFKVIAALLPVIYCGGLVYYFLDTSGSVQTASAIGLGPALLGLTGVGLLFCIPLFLKVMRLFGGPRSPGLGGGDGPDKGGFDPDAAIARYVAGRASQAAAAPSAPRDGGPAKPTGFGRRVR